MLSPPPAASALPAQPRRQRLCTGSSPGANIWQPELLCEFAITLFLCGVDGGGEDGMNGALVLSLSGSDGQIELRALILSYEH
jgi:hypothetical protein